MTARIEGRLAFDGLVEGRMPADEQLHQFVRAWAAKARKEGLDLDVEIEGGQFSLLASPEPLRARRLGDVPAVRVRELLERLVALFPAPREAAFFSTLRSVEIRPGQEVQTVYVIRPDGTVEAPERILDVDTRARPVAPSRRGRVRKVGITALALAALLGVISLFVDGGGLVASLWRQVAPLDVEAIAVDATAFDAYLEVGAREKGPGGRSLRLTLVRRGAYPTDGAALRRLYAEASNDPEHRLVLDAIARGYARAEILDTDGGFLGYADVRLAGLAEHERRVVEVALPLDPRPARLLFRP